MGIVRVAPVYWQYHKFVNSCINDNNITIMTGESCENKIIVQSDQIVRGSEMKTNKSSVFAILFGIAFGVTTVAAEVIVSDSFESGDMSAPGYDGFSWSRNNRTSIVNSTHVIWNNGARLNPIHEGKDWTAFSGENSLRFRYPAGENMAEQRFSLSQSYTELWFSFWLRVPVNFYHTSGNQKLFALWMDGYSNRGDGSTIVLEFRPSSGIGPGSSTFYVNVSEGGYNITGGDIGHYPFIKVPDNLGEWMHLVIRVAAESSPSAKDGILEVWRSWEGAPNDYVQTHQMYDLPIKNPTEGPDGFRHGYLMGWANGTYSEETEFLLDGFIISSTSLFSARPTPPLNPVRMD